MLLLAAWSFLFTVPLHGDEPAAAPVTVDVVSRFYDPNAPEQTPHLVQMMKEDPSLKIRMWSGLSLPGAARTPIIMAIAGETAPDVMESWFHIIRNDVDQGFLYPLNEWIGDDANGDGRIDPSEAKWAGWKDVPELWRDVATKDGKVYGIPEAGQIMLGVLFRTDLARNAGLDPNNPPRTWDEFYDWCLRLSDPGKPVQGRTYTTGQRGVALAPYGFTWLPWVRAAGGDPIVQTVSDPASGKEYTFPLEARDFRVPGGPDLSGRKAAFRANFDSPEGMKAAELFHNLRWMPWITDPETGTPIRLTEEQAAAGSVQVGARTVSFDPATVVRGVARAQSGPREASPMEMMGRGEAAMVPWLVSDLLSAGNASGVDPDLLSWFPFPSIDGKTPRVVQIHRHYATLCVNVGKRPKAERDKIWKVLVGVTDEHARDDEINRMVVSGLARFVEPKDLERLGFHDYLRDIPPALRRNFDDIDSGRVQVSTEPFQGFWNTMDEELNRGVLSLILASSGKDFDYEGALHGVTRKANNGVMFARSHAELDRYRGPARLVFGGIVALIAVFAGLIVFSLFRRGTRPVNGMVDKGYLPWLLLLPALLLIGLWGYYPLLKGMVMAFQNFRIVGSSPFVGLDNFITLALDRAFWASLARTLYYVALTMVFTFSSPILLAVMLSEVPRGKVFFRTLFFLPQVTSGLVIALLWKLMYDPSPSGVLNQCVSLLNQIPGIHIAPQSWLLDPKLAMICVILPGAWAGAGIHSLLYLAALKSVPEDSYEACELDGGSVWTKLRYVTLPVIMPLILINFVGTFIATFQNMGNIFLLTFGGPGESTMVVGMKIWIEAYNNLRFSIATSMAWVMGAGLIGFAYLQIQLLKRVEFRKSEE